ncbi:hypothetical protein GAYE_SCF26G4595 [Galdieria yellowstonensis]|uniref:Endoplasmic reticulum transmembrane protein n=1 Tax=Galdieria yellowstonensis TaxID=3028027 RepID=A0AAV9IH81_9RHOD|nr:hypothetical protein GAYE_SCF26G4595 [Galdieria yellowstonensis]
MLWFSVYLFLCVEIVIVALLVLPLPKKVRRLVLRALATAAHFTNLKKFIHYISLSLFFALVESLTDAYRVQLKLTDQTGALGGVLPNTVSFELHSLKQRQFRSQRNFYLAGFSLTLLFVIGKLFELTSRVAVLESQLEPKSTGSSIGEDDVAASGSNHDKYAKKAVDKTTNRSESKKVV